MFNKDNLTIKMDKETFLKERNEWNNQNLTNYKFTYDFFNDAGPVGPVTITIKEDEIPVIENSNQYNDHIIAKNISEIYDFINGTFDFIESVKNGTYNGHKIKSITLNIFYNTQYHFPTKVDLSTGYVESIDGGAYYTLNITKFFELNIENY
jgi:hypothetical protein